jgi:hypothetical protein
MNHSFLLPLKFLLGSSYMDSIIFFSNWYSLKVYSNVVMKAVIIADCSIVSLVRMKDRAKKLFQKVENNNDVLI